MATLGRTVRHFFPELGQWMDRLPDGRDGRYTRYVPRHLLWMGVLVFCLRLASRRQIRFELAGLLALDNLNLLAEADQDAVAHSDTLENYLRLLPEGALEQLRESMIRRLLRMKLLDSSRLQGALLVVVDGTGCLTFAQRHCRQCLSKKAGDGVLYYHPVLEAKLVTPSGLAFSLGTEFIENTDPAASKQDCEQKAFIRLAERLKKAYPQLRLCFLFDGLYANGTIFDTCRCNQWDFITTFKEGSVSALWREYQNAKYRRPEDRREQEWFAPGQNKAVKQCFAWVNGLTHVDDQGRRHSLNAFECREEKDGLSTTFVWLSSFSVTAAKVALLANGGGRCRWKIENEGFNIQKNGGYALEHVYSTHEQAWKHWYLLLQIAHLLMQLVERGNLLGDVRKLYGSFKAMARRLGESLRRDVLQPCEVDAATCATIQIRLNSS